MPRGGARFKSTIFSIDSTIIPKNLCFVNNVYAGFLCYNQNMIKHEGLGSEEVDQNPSNLEDMPPIDRLKYLLSNIEKSRWGSVSVDTFEEVIDGDKFSPFLKIVARIGKGFVSHDEEFFNYIRHKVLSLNSGENRDFDPLNKQFLENQEKISEEFPALPKFASLSEGRLEKIAPDAAAVVRHRTKFDNYGLIFSSECFFDLIADSDGNVLSASDEDNSFDLDEEAIAYLSVIHNNELIRTEVEKMLNLDLTEIPLRAQAHLLKFMSEADNGRFDNLCSVLRGTEDKNLRQKLLENFVAVDFGEDFGDSLLTIAKSERLSDAEKKQILDKISSCRESIQKITGLYEGFDGGQFAKEYARAANERLTDAVAVFGRIAENGVAEADLGWAGQVKFDFEAAMEALGYEEKSLEIVSGTLSDVATGKEGAFAEVVLPSDSSRQRLLRTLYNFYSPQYGYVLLYTRPEGSHDFDPRMEYGRTWGRNAGVEASISLITDPIDPFSLPNPLKPDNEALKNPRFYDSTTMDKVSAIRLDREGRAPGTPADDPDRDPVEQVGMVSVDLAAIGDRADTPSGKIARLLSVGGEIRKELNGGESSLNHNTKWFDQERYGKDKGFSELVRYIDAVAMGWCAKYKPGKKVESFDKKIRELAQSSDKKIRKLAQSRGGKARKAA